MTALCMVHFLANDIVALFPRYALIRPIYRLGSRSTTDKAYIVMKKVPYDVFQKGKKVTKKVT